MLLVGTLAEKPALGIRQAAEALRVALGRPEVFADVANNNLAARIVAGLCRPGMTFIDVGAHIGSVISAARREGVKKIIAFEAIPEKAARLAKKFPGVEIHSCALADVQGEASFFIDLKQSGYSSLSHNGANVREIVVPVRTLDSLVDADDVDVIKVDVEGAELGVLRGAEHVVSRCRPTIMFESGPENVLGYTKQDIFGWFDDRDYAMFLPNRVAHTGPPATLECFLDSHSYPRHTSNYFAVARERIVEIRDRVLALG